MISGETSLVESILGEIIIDLPNHLPVPAQGRLPIRLAVISTRVYPGQGNFGSGIILIGSFSIPRDRLMNIPGNALSILVGCTQRSLRISVAKLGRSPIPRCGFDGVLRDPAHTGSIFQPEHIETAEVAMFSRHFH